MTGQAKTSEQAVVLRWPEWHVELGGAAVVTLAAVALLARLVRLDWLPLDAREAQIALPALRSAQGLPDGILGAPLVFHAEWLVSWLTGSGDVQARLVAAACGAALVLAAWGLRPAIGRVAALAAAMSFALEPLWLFAGRNVAGGAMPALALVVTLALWVRGTRRAALAAAAAAGMTVAAGGPGLAFVLAGIVWLLLAFWRGQTEALDAALKDRLPDTSDRRLAAVAFAVALVVSASAGAMRPDGLAALIREPGLWLRELAPASTLGWPWFVLPLLVYAPGLLVFGAAGIVLAARSREPLLRFVALWAAITLVTGLAAGTTAFLLEALLPLTLVAAVALGQLAEALRDRARWGEDGVMTVILLIVLVYGLLQLAAFANASDQATGVSLATLAMGSVVLAILLACVFLVLWGWDVALRVTGLTLFVVLGVFGWANGTGLNYRASDTLRELVRPAYTAPGAAALGDAMSLASWTRAMDPNVWPAVADPSFQPYLDWIVRDREVRWAIPVGTLSEPMVVAVPGGKQTFGPSAYRGQSDVVSGRWDGSFGNWHGFVRWWLQRRQAPNAPTPDLLQADLYIIAE